MWPINITRIGHSVGSHAHDFTQNSEAVFLQDAYRAIAVIARPLCTSKIALGFPARIKVDEYWLSHLLWADKTPFYLEVL